MHPRKRAYSLATGDYITNISDVNPTFIGKVMSISRRSYMQEIHVKVVLAPTRPGQASMADEWSYPYDMAINVFRKLTEAEQLLYTLE